MNMYTVRLKNGLQWSFLAASHDESAGTLTIRRPGVPDISLSRDEVVFVRQKVPEGEVEVWGNSMGSQKKMA